MLHPTENTVQAVSFTYDRTRWEFKDAAVKPRTSTRCKKARHEDGESSVASRTLDDKTWVVAFLMDDGPVRYYLYDRAAKKAQFLFTNRKALEGLPLRKMTPQVIKSRDGLDLVSYLTLPPASEPDAARPAEQARADGAVRPRRPVGPRRLGLQPACTSGWPTAATPCSASTSAARPASARSSSTPATRSGPARCTTT